MKHLAVILGLIVATSAQAKVSAGLGMTQAFGGRQVPALHLGIEAPRNALSLVSAGVSTPAYFHSAYNLHFFWLWNVTSSLRAGVGPGVHLAFRGYRESRDLSAGRAPDFSFGPVAQVAWMPIQPVFLAMETYLGIRDWQFFGLTFQGVALAYVGVRL